MTDVARYFQFLRFCLDGRHVGEDDVAGISWHDLLLFAKKQAIVGVFWQGIQQLGHLRVWVSDTGKGIAPENCTDKLFERFVKIDEFEQGTGLGLSVCRSLAMSLGGNVGVESQLGKGSRFWVEIPFE